MMVKTKKGGVMNYSKFLKISIFVIVSLAFVACGGGGGKYAQAKKVISKQIQVFDEFATGMEKADNAKDVAKAMNNYADSMEKLIPMQQELFEKFPELKDQKEPPAELKEEADKIMEISGKIQSAFMKIDQYGDDPDVQKAQKRMEEIDKKMNY